MPSILTDFVDSLGCSHLTDTPEWRKTQHNSSICEAKTNQVNYKHTKKTYIYISLVYLIHNHMRNSMKTIFKLPEKNTYKVTGNQKTNI